MSDGIVEPFQSLRTQIYQESDHQISVECESIPTLRGSYELTLVYNNTGTRTVCHLMNHQQTESFLRGIFAGIQLMNPILDDGK